MGIPVDARRLLPTIMMGFFFYKALPLLPPPGALPAPTRARVVNVWMPGGLDMARAMRCASFAPNSSSSRFVFTALSMAGMILAGAGLMAAGVRRGTFIPCVKMNRRGLTTKVQVAAYDCGATAP